LNLGLDKIHLFRKGNESPIQELTNGIMIDGSWNGGEFVLKVSSNQVNSRREELTLLDPSVEIVSILSSSTPYPPLNLLSNFTTISHKNSYL